MIRCFICDEWTNDGDYYKEWKVEFCTTCFMEIVDVLEEEL
jgi:hypothetical protein